MKASELEQSRHYPNFAELAAINLEHVDAEIVLALQRLRRIVNKPAHPGLLADNWYRFDGSATSMHYAVGRLSCACDFFPSQGSFVEYFIEALKDKSIGGVGVYSDTFRNGKSCPMMHIDLRLDKVLWVRSNGNYAYYPSERYNKLLQGFF